MINLKFVPTSEPVVAGEGLYAVHWSQDRATYHDLGLRVRAKTAAAAESKVLFCFARELEGKTLAFDLTEAVRRYKEDSKEDSKEEKKDEQDNKQDSSET